MNACTPGTEGTNNISAHGAVEESRTLVMIVEDDTALRWLLSEAVEREGFEVIAAEDGAEALQLFRENTGRVWLVVADVFLPEIDGLTMATEMQKIKDHLFFIFMSGYDSERISKIGIRMEDIPRSEFFFKPFAFVDMIRKIKALQGSREGVENAE